MTGIDLVGAESACVRGVVENIRSLATACFFLGTALVGASGIFGTAVSSLLISLNSATSFLVEVATTHSHTQSSSLTLVPFGIFLLLQHASKLQKCDAGGHPYNLDT